MAGDAGLILACAGCCCGHPAHGGALSPQRSLKATLRRLHRVSGAEPPLPAELATRSFSWTGGGVGPAPPVDLPAS